MKPKYKVWDSYIIGKTTYMVLSMGTGFEYLPEGPIPCYITYDFTKQKVRKFSVEGIDRKTS